MVIDLPMHPAQWMDFSQVQIHIIYMDLDYNVHIIKHHLTLMIITTTMPFHNINYTILSLATIPYLHYGPLICINTTNFETKYARTPPPGWVPISIMAQRNTMCHVCIYEAEIFCGTKTIPGILGAACRMVYDVIGLLVSDLTKPK